MADQLVSLSILLFYLIALSFSASAFPSENSHSSSVNGTLDLISEIQEAKLRIARLESILEGTILDIHAKTSRVEETEKRVYETASEISSLQTIASMLKGESLQADERIKQLEEEVRLLWATLRRSNFDVHVLESKARDNKETLKIVASQVQKTSDIVTEQWIQIQQLEQALLIVKTRTQQVKGQGGFFSRYTSLMSVRDYYLPKVQSVLYQNTFGKDSIMKSYMSSALQKLERVLLAFKKYHLQLQYLIKKEMKKNKYLAVLAHNEVIFLLASVLITIPAVGAWIILFSRFSSEAETE